MAVPGIEPRVSSQKAGIIPLDQTALYIHMQTQLKTQLVYFPPRLAAQGSAELLRHCGRRYGGRY